METPLSNVGCTDLTYASHRKGQSLLLLQDVQQRKFLVSMANHGTVPIVRDVWEGTKIELYVVGVDDDKVVVIVEATSTTGIGHDSGVPEARRS